MNCCAKRPPENAGHREFTPSYRHKPITEKFYAHHETTYRLMHKVPYYLEQINKRSSYHPRTDYLEPPTSNYTYGWIQNQDFTPKTNEKDAFLFDHKRRVSHVMRDLIYVYNELKKLHIAR